MSLSDALRGRDGMEIGKVFKDISGEEYNVSIKEIANDFLNEIFGIEDENKLIFAMNNDENV